MAINTYPVAASGTTLTTAKKFSGKITKPTTDPFLGNVSYGATSRSTTEFGNSTWVNITGGGRIWTSTDGLTWNALKNNLLVAALTNTGDGNGTSAATQGVTVGYRSTLMATSLKFGGGIWTVYMSNGTLLTSTDLVTWTLRMTASATGGNANGFVAFGNSNWVLVTRTPKVFSSGDSWVTNTDRTTAWTTGSGAANAVNRVIWANTIWITIDSGGLITTSSDLATWTARTTPFGGTAIYDIATNSATAGATTVIVGNSGKWAYSTNGTTWTINTANGTEQHTNIIWDGSRFAIFSTSTTASWYSTNGQGGMTTGATRATVGTPSIYSQGASTDGTGKIFFTCGTTFQTTTNITTTWGAASAVSLGAAINQQIKSTFNPTYHSAVDGNGKIWKVGTVGRVWTSTDGGTTWTFANVAGLTQINNTTTASDTVYNGFAYVNGVLFAFPNVSTVGAALKYSTDNGVTWAYASNVGGTTVQGIAYGNGVYVVAIGGVVGASGSPIFYATTPSGTWTSVSSGSVGGATSGLFYGNASTAFDAAQIYDIAFDTTNNIFQTWAYIIGNIIGYARSLDGINWIGHTQKTKADSYLVSTINIMSPNNTTGVVTNTDLQSGSSVDGVRYQSLFMSKINKNGKEVILARQSTATTLQQGCVLASRTISGYTNGSLKFQSTFGKPVPMAPYLNVFPLSGGYTTAVDPIYLNYTDGYGWVAVYGYYQGGSDQQFVVLVSSDGEYWDVTGSLSFTSTVTPLVFLFTSNDSDRLIIQVYDTTDGSYNNTYTLNTVISETSKV